MTKKRETWIVGKRFSINRGRSGPVVRKRHGGVPSGFGM